MFQSLTHCTPHLRTIKLSIVAVMIQTVAVLGCTPPSEVANQSRDESITDTTSPIESSNENLANPSESHQGKTQGQKERCQNDAIVKAFASQRSDVQVKGCGQVIKLLADDNEGSRHQKFLVRLTGVTGAQNMTLLIAHNIDLAPRINRLTEGGDISFYGEYEFNPKGGVVHWTHRDPAARHQDGWIEVEGQRYQ